MGAIEKKILIIRGQKVMLDSHLAELYGVQTKVLIQAVKRNVSRFPKDFMFQMDAKEVSLLRSQIVISSAGKKDTLKFSKSVLVFTEQGVAMLSQRSQ